MAAQTVSGQWGLRKQYIWSNLIRQGKKTTTHTHTHTHKTQKLICTFETYFCKKYDANLWILINKLMTECISYALAILFIYLMWKTMITIIKAILKNQCCNLCHRDFGYGYYVLFGSRICKVYKHHARRRWI